MSEEEIKKEGKSEKRLNGLIVGQGQVRGDDQKEHFWDHFFVKKVRFLLNIPNMFGIITIAIRDGRLAELRKS